MGEAPIENGHSRTAVFLSHAGGFLFVLAAAYWLRRVTLEPDPLLQGYLQVISGLLAFVFTAVTLVRFQGTQDRISLILSAGFFLSGAALTATSVLFFQFSMDPPVRLLWAPVAWWLGRMILSLLLVVALLVDRFIPRSRHPRREIAGALLAVVARVRFSSCHRRSLPAAPRHPRARPAPPGLSPGHLRPLGLRLHRRNPRPLPGHARPHLSDSQRRILPLGRGLDGHQRSLLSILDGPAGPAPLGARWRGGLAG